MSGGGQQLDNPVQTDPSKRAANRVTKKIAAALTGKPTNEKRRAKGGQGRQTPDDEGRLMQLLSEKLAEDGPDSTRLREMLSKMMAEAVG